MEDAKLMLVGGLYAGVGGGACEVESAGEDVKRVKAGDVERVLVWDVEGVRVVRRVCGRGRWSVCEWRGAIMSTG
jgi:hypothetical protein